MPLTEAPRTIRDNGLTLHRERSFGCDEFARQDRDEYIKMGKQAVVRYYKGRAWLYVEPVKRK